MHRNRIALLLLALAAGPSMAQTMAPPQNVLMLSAQATIDVPQDLLTITLAVTRDGADAAAVQAQVRQVLDEALAAARPAVRPGQVDVRTGQFSLAPRYAPKGGISAWVGTAELVVEGRDMAAISRLAGRLSGMTVARVSYGLSREVSDKVEAEAAAQAIQRFRARAEDYAREFGFTGYTLREANVSQAGAPPPVPVFRGAMAQPAMANEEALPVQAGKASVTVSVSGSVQLVAR